MIKKTKLNISIKLDKDKTTVAVYLAVASFLLIFGLVSCKALIGQYVYQSRVISKQNATITNISTDQKSADNIIGAYKTFVSSSTNIIGGSLIGTDSNSGNSAKIILDALPQTYDFPALMTSLQSLTTVPGVVVNSLSGSDTSLSVTQAVSPTAIPISFSVTGSYSSIQNFLNVLQNSVRPIKIKNLALNGTDSALTASINAETYYYNPPSGLVTSTETVR